MYFEVLLNIESGHHAEVISLWMGEGDEARKVTGKDSISREGSL